MVEISLLRHFIAVVRTGGFTRAAEQLNTNQSVVSRAIRRLEQEIGAPLLERTSRNVDLTPAGEAFFAEAVAITERLAVAKSKARRIGEGETARLIVGVCPSAETEAPQIARGLLAFRDAWPSVDLQLRATNSGRQPQALTSAEIDLGIMRLKRPDRAVFESELICRTPLRVAVPAAWGLGKKRLRLDELSDRPWILPNPQVASPIYERLLEVCRTFHFEPRVAATVEDVMAARIMTACGVGVSFTYEKLGSGREGYEVVALDDMPAMFDAETLAAWAVNSASVHVRELVRCIVEAKAA